MREMFQLFSIISSYQLEDLQVLLYRNLLANKNCPKYYMFWVFAGLLPENRIMKLKLLFAHHLINLPFSSLGKMVFEEQTRLQLPGLSQEIKTMLAQLNIREGLLRFSSKKEFKRLVEEKIKIKNSQEIAELCRDYKKIDYFQLKHENFEVKSYFKDLTVKESRVLFSIHSNTISCAKMNRMSDPQFLRELYKCSECPLMSSTSHFLFCEGFSKIRQVSPRLGY